MRELQHPIFDKFETYKDLFDNAHDLIHLVEPDGKILYVNHAWEKNLGYSEEEVRGKLIYSLIIDEDKRRFKQYRESLLSGAGSEEEITVGLVTKAGNIVYAAGFISPRFVEGRVVYTRGIFRDVTSRLRNEEKLRKLNDELRERETNLHRLLFYAPDAIIVIDGNSIVQFWNPKAEAIFGWSQEEVLGRPLTQIIIPPQHRAAHEAGMKRFLETGEERVMNKTIEMTSLHKGGKAFHVALTISSTYQKGKIAFIAFIRDIEDQKVNARELEQKKAELEVSNRQLEQFAYVASHDMKEPIRKIMMFASHIRDEIGMVASQQTKVFFDKIQSAAGRLSEMVEGVLANSTLKAEALLYEEVNLNRIIENIEADLEYIVEESNAVIRRGELPTIQGSPFLLFQLFYNIISNSLKFARTGIDPVIDVSATRVVPADIPSPLLDPQLSWFQITVHDNGIGFPQDHAESIFKIFSRLHRRDQYEGTGMGLALCKSIVEKHHGFIQAFGTENEGSRFVIYLPERLLAFGL
jgi:two-component system sensor kinase FixL